MLIVFSLLSLSSCRFDQAKTQLTDKITEVSLNGTKSKDISPTPDDGDITDDQLQAELNNLNDDFNFDSDFKEIEGYLQ